MYTTEVIKENKGSGKPEQNKNKWSLLQYIEIF